ncbi:MAG: N-acetylmuramoyl-L-alanine amidase, partial [Prevotella sp.]
IGICYEGGLDSNGKPKDTRTSAQKEQLLLLIAKLKRLFPKALVRGHCEMPGATPKACPCFNPSAEYVFS